MNLFCIDYGTNRIGLSIATTPLAEPLGIITNSKNPKNQAIVSDAAITQIVKLLNQYQIEKIIVGISENTMADKSRAFINALKQKTTLPIEEIDETLSSVFASENMSHMKKKKRQGNRDHIAASIILQEYIDLHQSNSLNSPTHI